jgi:hypothetical protein
MPMINCELNGKPGFKWGQKGECYTYTPGEAGSKASAREKATAQGIVIGEISTDELDIYNQNEFKEDSLSVNSSAISFLKGLISSGKINNGSWSFSSADGNKLLGENEEWAKYGKVHLAINNEAEKETKNYYAYPVAKMVGNEIQIFRRGVIAAKAAAAGARGATTQPAIEKVANSLLEAINKKQKKEDSVQRYDFFPLLETKEEDSYMEEKFKRTPEGYLKGRAIVTNVGVFPYKMSDGSIKNELRLPEEVFAEESIKTLKNLPLGNEHPIDGEINVDNIKEYQVGFSGDDVRKDEYHLSNNLTWTDADTIEDIRGGKRGLSCGYKVVLEESSGVWMGIHYDAIQRKIRYNHIVVTDVGRAGDSARIKMDSGDAVCVQKINQEGVSMMKKIKIDGVEYDAEAPVITAYTQTQTELEALKANTSKEIDELKVDNQKLEAERDQLKEEYEKFKEDVKNDEGLKKEELEKAVQTRLKILDSAKRAELEIKEDMSEMDIKKEVIVKLFSGAKEKLDNADEVYINARFDGCLEKLDELEKERQETSEQLKGDSINKTTSEAEKYDSKAAYQRMVEREQNLWKGEDK